MYRPNWVHHLRDLEVALFSDMLQRHSGTSTERMLLEVGGGDGYMASKLIQSGYRVICTDPLPRHPSYCRVQKSDIVKLPFRDSVFDCVYSSNVLEHLPDFAKATAEMVRVLKPNGILVHSVPTVAMSTATSLLWPLGYPRRWYLALTGYFHNGKDFSGPFRNAVARRLIRSVRLQKSFRSGMLFARQVNPFRIIRTTGHGAAQTPFHELYHWQHRQWARKAESNHLRIEETVPVPVAFSMNKLLGRRLLRMRRLLARLGLYSVRIYVFRPSQPKP